MRRVGLLTAILVSSVVLVQVLAGSDAAVADTHLSEGCEALNDPGFDGFYTSMFAEGLFEAGEELFFEAGAPHTVTAGAIVRLEIMSPSTIFLSTPFPSMLSFTVDQDQHMMFSFSIRHFSGVPAEATWSVSCGGGPVDSDGDGVTDADDACSNTDLAGDVAPDRRHGKNRLWSTAAGVFLFGDGTDSGITVVDTEGCSASQIIDEAGLGHGHSKFGISKSAMAAYLASIA